MRSARQVIGSLLVALAIVAVTIALVTAKLGPGAGRDDHGGGGKSGKGGSEQREDR
jgi:Spy/CpxP family protein refolding chaperone